MTDIEYLFLTWDDVQRLAEKVADKIIDSSFKPDIVVAISRGGFDHARILCDQLDLIELASFQIAYYTNINEKNEIPKVTNPLNADIKGLKVLLVDDVSDSGNSLKYAKQYVDGLGPDQVRIATLHHKPWSNYEADYFAETVTKWIIYPWEMRESIQQITETFRAKGINEKDIMDKLRVIGFSKHHLNRYLSIIENV